VSQAATPQLVREVFSSWFIVNVTNQNNYNKADKYVTIHQ
jgi:hypothetical protein